MRPYPAAPKKAALGPVLVAGGRKDIWYREWNWG